MALKSTGPAAAMAATIHMAPVGGGGVGGTKNQQRCFSDIFTLNSEIKAKWRYYRGEMGAEFQDKAFTSGL
jgi:hypothetical protein